MPLEKSFRIEEKGEELRLKVISHKGSWWAERTALLLNKDELKELGYCLRSFRDEKYRQQDYSW